MAHGVGEHVAWSRGGHMVWGLGVWSGIIKTKSALLRTEVIFGTYCGDGTLYRCGGGLFSFTAWGHCFLTKTEGLP